MITIEVLQKLSHVLKIKPIAEAAGLSQPRVSARVTRGAALTNAECVAIEMALNEFGLYYIPPTEVVTTAHE